jgi:hypothetical protein
MSPIFGAPARAEAVATRVAPKMIAVHDLIRVVNMVLIDSRLSPAACPALLRSTLL